MSESKATSGRVLFGGGVVVVVVGLPLSMRVMTRQKSITNIVQSTNKFKENSLKFDQVK